MQLKIARACELIESVKDYRVLFGGDTIVDEYVYCTPLGKSPKENLVPVQIESREEFEGGVHAAANHVRTFCAQVDVVSTGPMIKKTRYIDNTYLRKLFETHHELDALAQDRLEQIDHDVVVVTDFGHGEYKKEHRKYIANLPIYLAVNAQTNSANVGYNLITQWPRADYVVIDEPEARLAAQDRESPIETVIEKLSTDRCSKFVVTRGTGGAVGFDGIRFAHCRAFTNSVVDTMGAGDAFFAVTAVMSKIGDIEDLLLIGNAAGALKCQIVGHRQSITKEKLLEFLGGLDE